MLMLFPSYGRKLSWSGEYVLCMNLRCFEPCYLISIERESEDVHDPLIMSQMIR
jgi:hypothetical protein